VKILYNEKIYLIATIFCWSLAIIYLNSTELSSGLTMLNYLPFSYFVGFAFLFGWIMFCIVKDKKLNMIIIFLIITGLWIIPLFLDPYVSFPLGVARYNYGISDYIFRNGSFIADSSSLWYMNWPGGMILCAIILNFIKFIEPDVIIKYSSILILLFYLLFLYLVVAKVTSDRLIQFFSLLLFLVGNWIHQTYYSSQSIAYILYILVIYLMTKEYREKSEIRTRVLLIIIVASIVTMHFLMSFDILLFMLLTVLFFNKKNFLVAIVLGVMIGSWSIYVTTTFFENNIRKIIEYATRLDMLFANTALINQQIGESAKFIVKAQLIDGIIYLLLTISGIAMLYVRIKKREIWIIPFSVVLAGSSVLILAGNVYSATGTGVEVIQRAFFYALPGIVVLSALVFKKKIIVLSVLPPLIFLFFIVHFSNLEYVMTPSERANWHFLEKSNACTLIASKSYEMGIPRNIELFNYEPYDNAYRANKSFFSWLETINPNHKILISEMGRKFIQFYYGDKNINSLKEELSLCSSYQKVYDNLNLIIYARISS